MSDNLQWEILSKNGAQYLYKAVTKIGEFDLYVMRYRDEGEAVAEVGDACTDLGDLNFEQAQVAALAWARQVLGAALVDAGADVVELFICDDCSTISNSDGPCDCDKNLKAFKYARAST